MKYKLRLFLQESPKQKGQQICDTIGCCFSTLESEYVPKAGELMYIDDDDTDREIVSPGSIYKVVCSVYCYNSKTGLSAVEVTVRKTNL